MIVNSRLRRGEKLFKRTITLGTETRVIDTRLVVIMANGSFDGTRTFSPDAHIDKRTEQIAGAEVLDQFPPRVSPDLSEIPIIQT